LSPQSGLQHLIHRNRRADGSPTGHADKACFILQHLDAFAGETPVSRFGRKLLRGLQDFLIGKDLSRDEAQRSPERAWKGLFNHPVRWVLDATVHADASEEGPPLVSEFFIERSAPR